MTSHVPAVLRIVVVCASLSWHTQASLGCSWAMNGVLYFFLKWRFYIANTSLIYKWTELTNSVCGCICLIVCVIRMRSLSAPWGLGQRSGSPFLTTLLAMPPSSAERPANYSASNRESSRTSGRWERQRVNPSVYVMYLFQDTVVVTSLAFRGLSTPS